MGKLAKITLMMAVVMLLAPGCKNDNTSSEPVMFPQVQVPSYINDQQQAVNYLARHFWDKFFAQNNTQSSHKNSHNSSYNSNPNLNGSPKNNSQSHLKNTPQMPSGTIHGVDSLSFEEAFGAYARLLTMADLKSVSESLKELFANLDSLALKGERKPLLQVMARAEHYFYDPNSPVLDEEIYLCALDGILAAKSLSQTDKMQYEYQHRICAMNRVGTPAADFQFRQLKGNSLPDDQTLSSGKMFAPAPPAGYKDKTLYRDIKSEYTLLFFNNPDCSSCAEILDAITDSPLITLVQQGRMKVLAMYIDEDLIAWGKNRSKYPAEWIYAFDHNLVLRDNNIYGLRAIPSLYLLDKEKRVLLKDATVGQVIDYIQKELP